MPLNVVILRKPKKCCEKVAGFFFENFHILQKLINKKIGMLQSLLICSVFNDLGAFHLVVMPAT